jgi:hypothetical protein
MRRVLLTFCLCLATLLLAEWVFVRNAVQCIKEIAREGSKSLRG